MSFGRQPISDLAQRQTFGLERLGALTLSAG
jgi:hypothetical protein